MLTTIFFFALYFASEQYTVASKDNKVLCYYPYWAPSFFSPEDIDVSVCTHVVYAFVELRSDGSLNYQKHTSVLKDMASLKQKNSKVKLMISAAGSKIFSAIAANSSTSEQLALNVIEFLENFGFDGFDVDWEYPAQNGGNSEDKENLVNMLETMKSAFRKNDYILSIAVPTSVPDKSYDIANISKIVDFINLMLYDMHSAKDGKTGENAPLYPSLTDTPWQRKFASGSAAVRNWKSKGADASKLLFGLPFYGRGYILRNSSDHGIGAPTTRGDGSFAYKKICGLKEGWTEVFDEVQKVPYKYNNLSWIGYDDPESIARKIKFIKEQKLGGVMIWSIDQDDIKGNCGTKFPLMQAIKNNL